MPIILWTIYQFWNWIFIHNKYKPDQRKKNAGPRRRAQRKWEREEFCKWPRSVGLIARRRDESFTSSSSLFISICHRSKGFKCTHTHTHTCTKSLWPNMVIALWQSSSIKYNIILLFTNMNKNVEIRDVSSSICAGWENFSVNCE